MSPFQVQNNSESAVKPGPAPNKESTSEPPNPQQKLSLPADDAQVDQTPFAKVYTKESSADQSNDYLNSTAGLTVRCTRDF